jgi:hypothetical protein
MQMEDSITLVSTAIKTRQVLPSPSYHARSDSFQVYVGKLGNAYIKNSEVAGQTDFFYGFGTAWVESTSISLRSCGGGITAVRATGFLKILCSRYLKYSLLISCTPKITQVELLYSLCSFFPLKYFEIVTC